MPPRIPTAVLRTSVTRPRTLAVCNLHARLPASRAASSSRPAPAASPPASSTAEVPTPSPTPSHSSPSSPPSPPSSSSTSSPAPSYFPAPTPAPAPDPNSEYTVPPLARPPGTPVPPVAADKSWAQRKDELLDRERHAASRRALVREATQGYFHDYNRVKRNGGKLWIGPPVLIREDRALYFPNISGKTLLSAPAHTTSLLAGHVSLVTVVNTRVSDEHVRSLAGPALDDWARVPGFRHVTINHQANALKSLLLGLFIGSLRSSVPKDEWGTYLISSGEWSPIDITGPLGIDNKLLGYVFLVDDACRIRWAGCGQAQGTEADDLRRATAVLMRRWQERTGAAAGAAETEIA